MEWYFASDGGDLVVPKDREPLDRLPSPDSWSEWGLSNYPKKNFDGKRFWDEVDINNFGHEMECSSNSSMSYGLHNNLHQWATLSFDQSDYQLNNLARMNQMDDILVNSLLDEDVTTGDLYGSSRFSPQSHHSMIFADNLLTDMIVESDHTSRHTYGLENSKYINAQAFPQTTDWKKREAATYIPSVKAPVLKDPVPSEQYNERQHVIGKTSPEESVLQELEKVTAKLTEKTRNCFRDSLYRLAENSKKQTVNPEHNEDIIVEKTPSVKVHDNTLRVGETGARESKANAIDRAIANLMFTKIDFSAEEFHASASLNFKREAFETTGQRKYRVNKPRTSSCFTMLVGDAEVPIIGREAGGPVSILSHH